MINRYSIGFVLVAGVAVAGVDYVDQAKKAGLGLGQMSLSAYADTVPQRIEATRAESTAALAEQERQAAWRKGGVQFLPEPPEGWTRRVLLEGDDSAIMPHEASRAGDGAGETLLQQMEGREKAKKAKKRATRSYVYERGTETVFVEVKLREKPDSNSLVGLTASILTGSGFGAEARLVGYDTIGGMGYVELLTRTGDRAHHFRVLEGRIGFGDEVTIGVHANAGSAATREILGAIDYDGLNTMLPSPLGRVGNAHDLPAGTDGADLAVALRELHAEFLSLRAREAQYRIGNLDTNALVFNTYAEQLGEGALRDITGGKDMNLGTLIDIAYHTAASAIRSGKSPDEVRADVARMVETAVTLSDAETAAMADLGEDAPAPAMSPELAAELGLDAPATPRVAGVSPTAGQPGAAVHSPGRALMEIDLAATEAAGGHVISRAVTPADLDRFRAERAATEAEMRLGLLVVSRAFETRHNLPGESCAFVEARHRLECDAAQGQPESGVMGFVARAIDQNQGERPKRLELSGGGGGSGGRCVGSFCD